jgi:undecaprenyl diphosphate synthase
MDLSDLRHIAVIMDGNGRWARRQGRERTRGHRAGVVAVRECVTECARAGLPWLTLYALSTENFRTRPPTELRILMALLKRFLVAERKTLMENRVRLVSAGRIEELPPKVVRVLRETERLTAANPGMTLCLALNYGGRSELADAARKAAARARAEGPPSDGEWERWLQEALYRSDMPDVDLLIRTAGEMRISNFLLFQLSYAEIWVTEVCWPDFRRTHLEAAVADYRRRARRFGGVDE